MLVYAGSEHRLTITIAHIHLEYCFPSSSIFVFKFSCFFCLYLMFKLDCGQVTVRVECLFQEQSAMCWPWLKTCTSQSRDHGSSHEALQYFFSKLYIVKVSTLQLYVPQLLLQSVHTDSFGALRPGHFCILILLQDFVKIQLQVLQPAQ